MKMKKNRLQVLQDKMHANLDKLPEYPFVCIEFGKAMFEISRFARMTIESYSAEGIRFGANIKRKNRRLKKENSRIELYSSKADTMAAVTIPNFYYLCQIGLWGILEEFMRDALFVVIKENLSETKKMHDKRIKKIKIQKDELVSLALERGRNDIDHLNKIYKEFLNVDLRNDKKFSKLFDMRKKRNVMAHSGFLFGYESPNKKKKDAEDFEKEVLDVSHSAGMEFIMAEPVVDKEGNKTMPDSWYVYDPTEAKSSKKLEDDFCDMVELVWELGYFISTKLFTKK